MKMKLLYSTLLSTTLLFASCVKEDNTQQMERGPEATISLKVPTQVASVGLGEDEIKDVRIVSFVPSTAPNNEGRLDVNGGNKSLIANPITQTLKTGVRDVYVFANETQVDGMTSKLNAVQSLDDLASIQIPYSGTLASPFFSYSVEPNFEIKKENNTSINAKVVRTVSKVRLTIGYKSGLSTGLPEGLVIDQVQVKQLPKHSYLVTNNSLYDPNDGYADSEVIVRGTDDVLNNKSQEYQRYTSGEIVIYIPEYLNVPDVFYSYIEILGHPEDNEGIQCKYKIPLGYGMGVTPIQDYDIPRNTEFIINATIKSYGETDNISIQANVVDWDLVNTRPDVGGIIKFDKATFMSNDAEAVEASVERDANVSDMGGVLTLSCWTNAGGWYTITRDKDGKVIAQTQPTASVTKTDELQLQSTTIQIPQIDYYYGQDYTVSIHHPVYTSYPIKPIDKFHFTQLGGFIPNSELLKGVRAENELIQWPADKLPPHGLQIAKIGNVLPTGVEKTDDPKIQFSLKFEVTGITEKALGSGRDNYAQLKLKDAVNYPIGQACKHLGPEWYIPSQYELHLIHANKSTLGSSYKFITGYYRSTTEHNDINSVVVNFFSGIWEKVNKTNYNYRGRCVRDI